MKKEKLNNKVIIGGILALVVVIVAIVVACSNRGTADEVKFKNEYEKLNGEKTANGSEYQTLKIDSKNKVKYATLSEAVDFLEEGTGLVYFGMPNCPWCRGILPTLLEKVNCSCLANLLYVDMTDLRNTFTIQDDEPVETKKAENAYYRALNILDDYLDNYKVTDGDGVEHVLKEKRIYVPLVVAVKDGRVVDAHTGSVTLKSTQTAFDELDDLQKSELGVIFDNMLEALNKENNVCDGHC